MGIEHVLVEWLIYYGDDEDTAAAMTRRLLKDLDAAGYKIVVKPKDEN